MRLPRYSFVLPILFYIPALEASQFTGQSGLILEAEVAERSGGAKAGYDGAAGNGAYVILTAGAGIQWDFTSSTAGADHPVYIRFRRQSSAPQAELRFNDRLLGTVEFSAEDNVWSVQEIPQRLRLGANRVSLQGIQGEVEVDALVVGQGVLKSEGGLFQVDVALEPNQGAYLLSPAEKRPARPRHILTTDGEVDDRSSFARWLLYTSDFEVVGIVPTNSKWQKNGHGTGWIGEALNHYESVLPNLRIHNPDYPEADFLRSRVFMGNEDPQYLEAYPPHVDTPATELIIRTLLDDDPRPVHINCWGGANTVAHALWKLRQTTTDKEFTRAIAKARIYSISLQDTSGRWIIDNVPEAQFVHGSSFWLTWNYHPQLRQPHKAYMSEEWLDENVQLNHGALGAWYPQNNISEGDTPAFLGLIRNGLNAHESYRYGGWGGRFRLEKDNHWEAAADNGDTAYALTRWTIPTQNDFAARMDWCVAERYEDANHHPVVVINGDEGDTTLHIEARPGQTLHFSKVGTYDPDGDDFAFTWQYYREAGTYDGTVVVHRVSHDEVRLTVPPAEALEGDDNELHILFRITDSGTPPLDSYRRAIIHVAP